MRLGVYVGSFDPVHKAHIKVIKHVIENNYVDKVIVIATTGYWDKQQLTKLENRIDMLKFYESDNIIINTNLNKLSYTYEILNKLKEQYPSDELYLIIGADNVKQFHLWKEVDSILTNKVLILPRNDIDVFKYIDNFKQKNHFIVVKDFNSSYISSTEIRELVRSKKYRELDELIDSNVLQYIIENNIY